MPRDRNKYFEGGPDVVVEIRSPGDESREKLDFYADVGVSEVWIIDRDDKSVQVLALNSGRYTAQSADPGGWVRSELAEIEMRPEAAKLLIRVAGVPASEDALP